MTGRGFGATHTGRQAEEIVPQTQGHQPRRQGRDLTAPGAGSVHPPGVQPVVLSTPPPAGGWLSRRPVALAHSVSWRPVGPSAGPQALRLAWPIPTAPGPRRHSHGCTLLLPRAHRLTSHHPPRSQLGASAHRLELQQLLLGLQGGWSGLASVQTLWGLNGDSGQGPRSGGTMRHQR